MYYILFLEILEKEENTSIITEPIFLKNPQKILSTKLKNKNATMYVILAN